MVVYRYVAERNPEGLYLDGVPLRDLGRDDLEVLPKHLLLAVAESDWYEAIGGTDLDQTVFVPPAVVEAVDRVARRRPTAAKDENAAAAVVAAPSADQGE